VALTEQDVINALRGVKDPDINRDLLDLNMIADIKVDGNDVSFAVVLTTPACPMKKKIRDDCEKAIRAGIENVGNISIEMKSNVVKSASLDNNELIPGVKNAIAISSGKGGVGKSTVAVNLAIGLSQQGAKVGLLDCDIYGPNIPSMLQVKDMPPAGEDKMNPPLSNGIKLMSMGLVLKDDEPVIWRGPMLHGVIKQFLGDVDWGDLDYLIIDMPPGTGDVQLTISQLVPLTGVVIVTTPQDVALLDAGKGLAMFRKVNVPVLGIVENMSYYICPKCGNRDEIFSHGGGEKAAERLETPFLGAIPLQINVRLAGDKGAPILLSEPDSPEAEAFRTITGNIAAQVSKLNLEAV
jgi:ATP-binding protein involved in chromosome partitioning